jgi:hypothetical protein
MSKELYELEELLGSLEDLDLEYYSLTRQKIKNSLVLVVNINDLDFKYNITLLDFLKRYFTFITSTGKNTPKYISLRNNLEKHFLYEDEEYLLKISYEDKELYSGKFGELHWREFEKQSLFSRIKGWNLKNKLNLKYGFFKIEIKLNSSLGKTRLWHEEVNYIFDTESYLRQLFNNKVVKVLDQKLKESKQSRFHKTGLDEILKERSLLWDVEINWDNSLSIPFNLFQIKNTVHYWEYLSLFFDLKYNYKLFSKSLEDSQNYNNLLREYIKALNNNQPLFMKYRGYKYNISFWERLKRWIKILKN